MYLHARALFMWIILNKSKVADDQLCAYKMNVSPAQWVRTLAFELGIMYMFLIIIIFITPCCTISAGRYFELFMVNNWQAVKT